MSSVPRRAVLASAAELSDVVEHARAALLGRGEWLASEWFDRAVVDLRSGALRGWYLPEAGTAGPGIAFASDRAARVFGHVHVDPGDRAAARALRLAEALLEGISTQVRQLDFGISGLSEEDMAEFETEILRKPHLSLLRRFRMVRSISAENVPESPVFPDGWSLQAASRIPVETLQALDWAAFRGSVDEQLIAESPESNRRVLEGILGGNLGSFLSDASPALQSADGSLIGFLLTTEASPRSACFVDLAILPEYRRRGLATRLFAYGRRALYALGYSEVTLWVTEANDAALALYQRTGFRQSGKSSIYLWKRSSPAPDSGALHPQRAR